MARMPTASEALASVFDHDASSDDNSEIEEDCAFPLPTSENSSDNDEPLTPPGSSAYSTPFNTPSASDVHASALQTTCTSSGAAGNRSQPAPPPVDVSVGALQRDTRPPSRRVSVKHNYNITM